VTPHIAVDGRVSKLGVVRKTAVDGRTTRHPGYRASQTHAGHKISYIHVPVPIERDDDGSETGQYLTVH
jgi:hypothetical protein